jgi:hypothetical protein
MQDQESKKVIKPKSSLKRMVDKASNQLSELTGFKVSSVVGIQKEGDGWTATIEMLEKAGIPDRMDILGTYEVKLDSTGDLLTYDRKGLRKRGDTGDAVTEVEE